MNDDATGTDSNDGNNTSPPPPTKARLLIPDSLLSVESTEEAIVTYFTTGLKPIPIHAPTENGGCSCGKKHDITTSGSSSAGKHPIEARWQKKQPSLDQLRDQLARLKFTPNVGLVLGKQPGTGEYLIAIDIDDAERFAKVEAELGELPRTPRCDSGRGYRLFYLAPAEIDLKRLVNVTGLGGEPGVDAKVEGGQVVVAPSVHANGKRYKWTVTGEIAVLPVHWAMQLLKAPEEPQWISEYTPQTLKDDKRAKNRAERWLEVAVLNEARALAACRQGSRNNTLFRTTCMLFEKCAGVFLGHKWQWIHDEMLAAARACGLTEHESRRTIASADRTVRESGKVRIPVWLADPAPSKPPVAPGTSIVPASPDSSEDLATGDFTAPAPPDDPWALAPNNQRPRIRVTYELHINVDEAIQALRADENLYQREKKLVCVTRVSREQSSDSPFVATDDGQTHRQLIEGTPQIVEIEIPTLRERLTEVAVFQKWVEKTQRLVPIIPTDEIVSGVHKRKGEWPGIRNIIGVIETPIMRSDGSIIQKEGYDRHTQYVYMPGNKFPDVTDAKCTEANARWSFDFLKEIFEDFPYVTAAHRSVPIAAILTLIARTAILGSIPAFLFDASTRGSGKTLQTDAIAMVATGRGAPRMNYTVDEIELEKILAGYAMKGSSFICLDNVPAMRPFGGGPIDRVITARDDVELRVLGANKVLTLPWRALIMATGNNMSLYGDTGRRVLMARLEPTEENPEHRTKFRHDDLLGWIRKERPRLVAASLCILRSYFRAGRPDMGCARWGSFEEWSRLIPHAIKFAGGADPMLARPEGEEEVDQELRSIRCFLTRIREAMGDDDFRLSSVIELLYKCERQHDSDGFQDVRDAIELIVGRRGLKHEGKMLIPDPVEFGRKLAAFKGRVISGLRLTSKTGGGGIMRWRIEQVTSVQVISDSCVADFQDSTLA